MRANCNTNNGIDLYLKFQKLSCVSEVIGDSIFEHQTEEKDVKKSL